ncbi:MAG: aminotransferase class III-fold pyridoxal phosphate-dependent enzyme, partial [Propionicimonas sp.]
MTVQAVEGGSAAITSRYSAVMMNAFGTPKRVFVRGEGSHLWDADGRRYLDLLAGLAVNSLGHAHPQVLGAISSQLATLGHVSNFFATPTQVALAERLAAVTTANAPGTTARVFFTNSGTEANEAGFKLTRLTGRHKLIAMAGSFHGRSLGALALTSNPKYRAPFEPLPGEVVFVP